MGATEFMITSRGETSTRAFKAAVDRAAYEHGHGGYTGTIAEKGEFVEIRPPADRKTIQDLYDYANELLNDDDVRISDKWGPAGCIKLKEGEYLFFGYASC